MTQPVLKDLAPSKRKFLADTIEGLTRFPKSLPCKYFYDRRGSALFEQICQLDEYYLTRTETAIMEQYAGEMTEQFGRQPVLVELGSGSSVKTRFLLDQLDMPSAYVPVDISKEHLRETAKDLAGKYPQLRVRPVCADFTKPFALPTFDDVEAPFERVSVYFPGSTIGNFSPFEATELLEGIGRIAGDDGGLLIGVDLYKAKPILEAAYNDSAGVTAKFNRNILRRINRELGADFDLQAFEHRADFNEVESRVEIHLESRCDQVVQIGETVVEFEKGETIHTENSYKYRPEMFRKIAASSGWRTELTWSDPRGYFSVQYLTRGTDSYEQTEPLPKR